MESITFAPLIIGAMRLGQWGSKYNTSQYEAFIESCVDMGLTDFDHADIYGDHTTEMEFGKVMATRPDLRARVELTTKCGIMHPSENRPSITVKHYDSSKDHIVNSVNASLKNLQVEKIKLLLIHRPDYLMDVQEIVEAFDQLKTSGKVDHFGVSNFTQSQFQLLNENFPLVNNQLEFSLTHPFPLMDEASYYFQQKQVKITAWSPLGGGKVFDSAHNPGLTSCLEAMGKKYDCGADQILYAWITRHPLGIIPVSGTAKISRVKDTLAALDIELTREDWYALLEKSLGHKVA